MAAWLLICGALSLGLPAGAIAGAYSVVAQHNRDIRAEAALRLGEARAVVGSDTSRWLSANWRRQAASQLNRLKVEVRLNRAGTTLLAAPSTFSGDAIKRDPAQGSFTMFASPQATAMLYASASTINADAAAAAAGLAAALTGATLSVMLLRRVIARPLAKLRMLALEVAEGELDVEPPSSGSREIKAVAQAFALMANELRTARNRQEEVEHERRLFIAAIVHDLRTPLFLLRGNLAALARGLRQHSRDPETYLAEAQLGADALERLVDDLFMYTRLEYLDERPREEPVEIATLLQAAIAHTNRLAADKALTLEACGPREGCPTIADPNLITRVVQNLLENAVRHTPVGGRIGVTWACEHGRVAFTIGDSGPGFEPHDLPHVFEPLYRGKSHSDGSTTGAGLGLAIARQAVQAHGGTIEASNAPRGGAVLRVTLPLATESQ